MTTSPRLDHQPEPATDGAAPAGLVGRTVARGPRDLSAMPFRHLLVGVDGSAAAAAAATVALDLAAALGARLTVVAIVDTRFFYPPGETPPLLQAEEETVAMARVAVRDVLDQAHSRGVACVARVIEGEVLPTLVELKADLLVVGTHQHRGLRRLLPGSTAGAISRKASCPVLIVPTSEEG